MQGQGLAPSTTPTKSCLRQSLTATSRDVNRKHAVQTPKSRVVTPPRARAGKVSPQVSPAASPSLLPSSRTPGCRETASPARATGNPMAPLLPDIDNPDHAYCGDTQNWCSPPPVLPPPSPCPPPSSSSSSSASHGRGAFVTALIIAASVLAFLAICLSIFLVVRRRRQRRRREALLEAAALGPAAPAAFPDAGNGAGGPGEDVVHHAWHIRTVGLDEAAIESIALTRYRAGANGGVLGAADCAICLGDFRDGELLRLLPKCAHAFHVQCIDTWLRTHVNCPLCRADVMGAAAAAEQPHPSPGADAEQAAGNIGTTDHEQPGQHANEQRVQIDQRDQPNSSSEQPRQRHGPRGRNFRRVASMDSPSPIASAEEAPEDEQAGSEKQGTGGAVCCEVSPGFGRLNRPAMKRSLSAGSRWTLLSRCCRERSSLLPL